MNRTVDVATSHFASVLRGGAGIWTGRLGPRPARSIHLYDHERSPACRWVRESATTLDLTVSVFPCPPGGQRFRPRLVELGGKAAVPFMIDPNTAQKMYGAEEIVRHLFDRYGAQPAPSGRPIVDISGSLVALIRPERAPRPGRLPERTLELYSYEASPYCRLVRDALAALELPYILRNVGIGSPRRAELVQRAGKMQVPYLVDPNADIEMLESADIIEHLKSTYGA